jgi:hypothetical protein
MICDQWEHVPRRIMLNEILENRIVYSVGTIEVNDHVMN